MNLWQGLLRFVRDRIGYKAIGLAASVALVSIAVYVLWKKLRSIDPAQVWAAIGNVSGTALGLAALSVFCAYFTLTFYDYFATRTIGRRDVSYRNCAIAAFSSYSIAHNLGATVFTGTVVRYLIYSRYGLTAIDVIKVSFIAGLTFWLGNAAILGLGLAYEPWAVAPILTNVGIDGWHIRALGILVLLVLAGYVAYVHFGHRDIGQGAWKITLPDAKLTSVQILIGIADLTFCALAMYALMPGGPNNPSIHFETLAVIFIASTLLGFASHTPGGLGVFEASMLVALPDFNKEELIAALLLYRLFYFLIPFILALAVVAIREISAGHGVMEAVKSAAGAVKHGEELKK